MMIFMYIIYNTIHFDKDIFDEHATFTRHGFPKRLSFSGKEGTFMTAKALRCRPTGCFVRLAGGIFFCGPRSCGLFGTG